MIDALDLAYFYSDHRLDFTRRGGKGPQIPPNELAARRSYVTTAKELNRRGGPAQGGDLA